MLKNDLCPQGSALSLPTDPCPRNSHLFMHLNVQAIRHLVVLQRRQQGQCGQSAPPGGHSLNPASGVGVSGQNMETLNLMGTQTGSPEGGSQLGSDSRDKQAVPKTGDRRHP